MRNPFKKPTPEALRLQLLEEHQRRLVAAEVNFAHAKANLDMERAIVERLGAEEPTGLMVVSIDPAVMP